MTICYYFHFSFPIQSLLVGSLHLGQMFDCSDELFYFIYDKPMAESVSPYNLDYSSDVFVYNFDAYVNCIS